MFDRRSEKRPVVAREGRETVGTAKNVRSRHRSRLMQTAEERRENNNKKNTLFRVCT